MGYLPGFSFRLYDDYAGREGSDFLLPTVQDLQRRIYDLNTLDERIQEYTRVEIHGKTYQLSNILGKYNTKHKCIYDTKHESYILRHEQMEHLRKTFGPKPDVIYHLAYFDIYPSILFDHVTSTYNTEMTIKTKHITTISHALSIIDPAIGSEMTYDGVLYAINLLHTNELMDTELKTILSNEMLQLTSLDVTHFRAVKLLYDISIPLQNFINACVKCKFQIVDSDAAFKSLQVEAKRFYATESNYRQKCLSFFNRLYDILYFQSPNDTNNSSGTNPLAVSDHPHIYLLHKIKELTKIMNVLELLSHVSHGPKLRQYFREMGWFEHDTIFDEDYNSLTTALSNYDAFQEALIVEQLGPVVRYFITVEKLERCQNIKLLLFNARNEKEIQSFQQVTPSMPEEIHKLNSRLNSITDLFRNVYALPSTTNLVPNSQSTTSSQANTQIPNVPSMVLIPPPPAVPSVSIPQSTPHPSLPTATPPRNTFWAGTVFRPSVPMTGNHWSPDHLPFIASDQLDGPMVGYVFRRGTDGLGYYRDTASDSN